jgi:hypothetical protein
VRRPAVAAATVAVALGLGACGSSTKVTDVLPGNTPEITPPESHAAENAGARKTRVTVLSTELSTESSERSAAAAESSAASSAESAAATGNEASGTSAGGASAPGGESKTSPSAAENGGASAP